MNARISTGDLQQRLTIQVKDMVAWLVGKQEVVVPASDVFPQHWWDTRLVLHDRGVMNTDGSDDDDDDGDDGDDDDCPTFDAMNGRGVLRGSQSRNSVQISYQDATTNDWKRQGCLALLVLSLVYLVDQQDNRTAEGDSVTKFVSLADADAFFRGVDTIVVECKDTRGDLARETVEAVRELERTGNNRVENCSSIPLLGSEDARGVSQRVIRNTGIRVTSEDRVVAFASSTGRVKDVTPAGFVWVSGGGQDRRYHTPLGRVVESFLARFSPDLRKAWALFAEAAATVKLDAKCAWRANPPHADHFLLLDRHDLTRMASPYQNWGPMGSKTEAWRPGEDTCSQFQSWTWTDNTSPDNTPVTISGEGPFDFIELGIPILPSDEPGVADALARGTFRTVYPLAEYPLIYDTVTGSLVSRHGQVYSRKTQVGSGRRDPNEWSLRKLHLSRTLYPRFARGTTPVDCHSLMARLTIGERPDGRVVDHKSQDNKEDFSEENLEYVTSSENSSRHHAWKRRQAATASEAATTWVETVQVSEKEWKNEEEDRKRKNSAIGDGQMPITRFFKRQTP